MKLSPIVTVTVSFVISLQPILCINAGWLAALDETLIPLDIMRALLRGNSSSVALKTGIPSS